jgi:hypothetical protein
MYSKPEFKIDASFAGILNFKILESLYGPKIKKADQIGSLNEHIENSKNMGTELGDLAESFRFTYLWRPDNENYSNPIYDLMNREEDTINSVVSVVADLAPPSVDLHTYFVVSIGIIKFISRSRFLSEYEDRFLSSQQREVYEMCKLEIMKRLQESA